MITVMVVDGARESDMWWRRTRLSVAEVLWQRADLPEQSTIKKWQLQKRIAELLLKVSGRNRFNACGRIFMTLQMSQTTALIFLKSFGILKEKIMVLGGLGTARLGKLHSWVLLDLAHWKLCFWSQSPYWKRACSSASCLVMTYTSDPNPHVVYKSILPHD